MSIFRTEANPELFGTGHQSTQPAFANYTVYTLELQTSTPADNTVIRH